MEKVYINTEYIKLSQLLKLAGVVLSGSEAKEIIQNGYVSLNNEIVFERGKKIYVGNKVDVKEFGLIEVYGNE